MGHVRCPVITSDHVSQPQFGHKYRDLAHVAFPAVRLGHVGGYAPAGWKSSIGLPEGSSSRICFPPGPVTMSLRKCTPSARRRSTSAAMLSTTNSIRFQPPGSGLRPSGMGLPAELVGPLSSSRRFAPEHASDHVADVDCFFGHVPHLLAGRSSTLSVITGPRGHSPLEAFQHPGHVVLESVAYLLALEPGLQHREKGLAVPFLERDLHRGVQTASPLPAEDRLPVDEAARIVDLGENAGFAIRLRAPPPVNNGPRAANAQIEVRFDDRAQLSSELSPSIEERVKDRLGWSIEQPLDPQLVPHVVSEASCRSDRSRVPR